MDEQGEYHRHGHHHHHHGEGYPEGGYQGQGGYGYEQPRREFYIVSEMNAKVVDIAGGNAAEGANAVMYDRHSEHTKNQLWFLDPEGQFIRSTLNGMVFSNAEKGHGLKMTHFTGQPGQQWRLEGKKILNGLGQCLDIRGASSHNSAEVCAYDYDNKPNQHWEFNFTS